LEVHRYVNVQGMLKEKIVREVSIYSFDLLQFDHYFIYI
jgi:hypothetical protein